MRLVKGKDLTFAYSACLIFIYRVFVSWQNGIRNLWQDEISWTDTAGEYTLQKYIFLRDSGYPVPGLRFLLWTIVHVSPNADRAISLHIITSFITALACSSLIFLNILDRNSRLLLSLTIGTFPSFDLLLLHNISYYTFIPLMVALFKVYENRSKFHSVFHVAFVVCLLFFTTKPQLLASVLQISFFWFAYEATRKKFRIDLLGICLLVSLLLLSGRVDAQSLDLRLTHVAAISSLLAVPAIITLTLFPLLGIGALGAANLFDSKLATFSIWLTLIIFPFMKKSRRVKISKYSIGILIILLPIHISMFVFPNSGWSFGYFWFTPCTECLFQRHYFPTFYLTLIFLFDFMASQLSQRLRHIMISTILLQLVILQVLGYSRIYHPV